MELNRETIPDKTGREDSSLVPTRDEIVRTSYLQSGDSGSIELIKEKCYF